MESANWVELVENRIEGADTLWIVKWFNGEWEEDDWFWLIDWFFFFFSRACGQCYRCTAAYRLIVLTLSPPTCLDVPTFAARYPHVHNDARDPSRKRWNYVGKNWPLILPEIVTSTSIQGSFTCRKSATWDPRLYFPSEGRRAEDFFALKNPDSFGRVWTRELGYIKAACYH